MRRAAQDIGARARHGADGCNSRRSSHDGGVDCVKRRARASGSRAKRADAEQPEQNSEEQSHRVSKRADALSHDGDKEAEAETEAEAEAEAEGYGLVSQARMGEV